MSNILTLEAETDMAISVSASLMVIRQMVLITELFN